MITALQKTKISKLFSQLDVNGNGFIEERDVSALAQRVLSGVGASQSSPKGLELVRSYLSAWTKLAQEAGVSAGGRISPEEVEQGMKTVPLQLEVAYDRYFHPTVVATWELLDADGDGSVSREKFDAFQAAFGTPPTQVDKIFTKFDTDGDGKLDKDEMIEHARDFYTSADENATGNWLFGAPS